MIATAGWWRGADIDDGEGADAARAARAWDRGLMWSALQEAGVARQGARPDDDDAATVVDAAVSYVAKSPCQLKVAPIEDLLASDIQPNTPGTTTEKPNWRHRFAAPADRLLNDAGPRERAARLGPPRSPA
jgi:4-alpha-glucanotransferase